MSDNFLQGDKMTDLQKMLSLIEVLDKRICENVPDSEDDYRRGYLAALEAMRVMVKNWSV
jgi:hypothetical protein